MIGATGNTKITIPAACRDKMYMEAVLSENTIRLGFAS